ncbi:MAG TPA: hypothetical protein VIC30_02110 [Orrella sp.]
MNIKVQLTKLEIGDCQVVGNWQLTAENGTVINADYVDIEALILNTLENDYEGIDNVEVHVQGDNVRHCGWFIAQGPFN